MLLCSTEPSAAVVSSGIAEEKFQKICLKVVGKATDNLAVFNAGFAMFELMPLRVVMESGYALNAFAPKVLDNIQVK